MSASEQPAVVPPVRVQSRRSGMLVLVTLAAVLVLALGMATTGYYWTRFVAEPGAAAVRARLDEASAGRAALELRLAAAEQRLQTLDSTQSTAVSRVDELRQTTTELARSLHSLAVQGGDKPLDWVLAECEYLILAASGRLALEHDVARARAALLAADQRLRAVDHPAVDVLRERLATDLQALAAVAVPDIEGLSLKFAAHIRKVDILHTKPIAAVDTSLGHVRQPPVTPDNWRGALRAMWDSLVSLVEIKDGELPDSVLFDPKLRYFLEQNLKLELSSARLAILQRDTANFRVAVELVQSVLERYFDPQDAAVKSLADMLVEVRGVELAPTLPDVSASLDAVRAAREALAAPHALPELPSQRPSQP